MLSQQILEASSKFKEKIKIMLSQSTLFGGLINDFELTWLNIFIFTSIGLFLFAIYYIWKIWQSYKFFKKLGLKTPKHEFIYGNLKEILAKGHSSAFQEWTADLGKTYGFYEGHFPVLVTSDLELIQEIFIKKFNYFSPRKMSPHIWSDNGPFLELFHSGGETWKRMRTIMNPTFTTNKIKTLVPLMEKCGNRFLNEIEQNSNKDVKVSDYFDRLTMDTIFNCAFGIDINPQKNPNDLFMAEGLRYFRQVEPHEFDIKIRLLFHEFKPFVIWGLIIMSYTIGQFNRKWTKALVNLYSKISFVLERRLKGKISKRDYAQILIDSCTKSNDRKANAEFVDYNKMRIEKTLSENEIITNLVLFLLTGFETTSSALSYCIYEMTQHPNEMAKLQAEVDAFFPPESEFEPNLESVQNMTHMDMFFKEVLRMHPIANGAITRRCVEPITIKGINFTRNLPITIDVLSLHYSEDYWENPYEFDPTRFSPEKTINPLVYMPFGLGPRTCIGMRFAQLEVKLMMIKLLRKYDILATTNIPQEMVYSEGIVRRPKFGVSAVFRPRTF